MRFRDLRNSNAPRFFCFFRRSPRVSRFFSDSCRDGGDYLAFLAFFGLDSFEFPGKLARSQIHISG